MYFLLLERRFPPLILHDQMPCFNNFFSSSTFYSTILELISESLYHLERVLYILFLVLL